MRKYIPVVVIALFLVGVGCIQISTPKSALAQGQSTQDMQEQLDLFAYVLARVQAEYVEDVNAEELVESAIDGMLTSLDPHSSYLSAQDAEAMREQTRGTFGGLGIEITQEEGFVKVIAPIDETPAANAGMQSGDFITHADGQSLLGLTLQEAVEILRGPVGSDIVITVVREGETEPFDVTITRDTIKLTAVRDRVIGETVVIRVTTFNEQTYDTLEEKITAAFDEVGTDNVDGVVLDLRNNPGGLLSQAIYVTDAFLNKGEIVSTRGRDGADAESYSARRGDLAQGKPIVVLINGGSASASEIVAGALQDHKRAVVVGTRSFGKGSVQTIMGVPGDGAMRLTTARYYTPSGRSIQALGVSPDIVVEQPRRSVDETEETRPDRSESSLRGALDNDSLSQEEREQIELERAAAEDAAALRDEDYQLAYAIDLIKGLAAIAAVK